MSTLRQAPESLNVRAIAWVVAIATLVFVVAVVVAWWMTPAPRVAPERAFVTPRGTAEAVELGLLDGPARGLVMRAEAEARLRTLGWTDREAGVAHVPIEAAMELVAGGERPPGAGEAAFGAAEDLEAAPPAVDDPGNTEEAAR